MENITDALASAWNTIVENYKTARAALRDAKKNNGKKSAETKAARKVVRAIKKERAAFVAANPGFTPAPKAPRKAGGIQRKEEAPPVDRGAGEALAIFKNGIWYKPDGVTPDDERNGILAAAGSHAAPRCEVGEVHPMDFGEPAQVATAPVAAPKTLSAAILGKLGSTPMKPAEVAAAVTAAGEGNITAKQAADALARLAKTGKCSKLTEGYTALTA